MSELLDRLGVERPVVQAGMGGGISRARLAAAVSGAGGLGTIGFLPPGELRREIAAAREQTERPVAANLLLPFAGRAHAEAAAEADAVVTFWGEPRRPGSARVWLHQAGSLAEARAAREAGADGVIVQGREAGGHVRGKLPALELLAQARAELPAPYPLLLAGGIATADDVRTALDAGADAAVLGTRFVMTPESGAHPAYRERLVEARETVLTELFGMGWPDAPHRVVENEAVRRWRRRERPIGALNRLTGRLMPAAPTGLQERLIAAQRPAIPLLSPYAPTDDRGENLLESGPLYAGETVARIGDVRSAAELVRELAPPTAQPRPA